MLADYYARSAVAAAQVLAGFDEEWFRNRLNSAVIGIGVGPEIQTPEGAALADLLVRLLARLYPRLAIIGEGQIETLSELARRINPQIELVERAELGLTIGDGPRFATTTFAGSDGWDALLSQQAPQPIGTSDNALGAGAAACL